LRRQHEEAAIRDAQMAAKRAVALQHERDAHAVEMDRHRLEQQLQQLNSIAASKVNEYERLTSMCNDAISSRDQLLEQKHSLRERAIAAITACNHQLSLDEHAMHQRVTNDNEAFNTASHNSRVLLDGINDAKHRQQVANAGYRHAEELMKQTSIAAATALTVSQVGAARVLASRNAWNVELERQSAAEDAARRQLAHHVEVANTAQQHAHELTVCAHDATGQLNVAHEQFLNAKLHYQKAQDDKAEHSAHINDLQKLINGLTDDLKQLEDMEVKAKQSNVMMENNSRAAHDHHQQCREALALLSNESNRLHDIKMKNRNSARVAIANALHQLDDDEAIMRQRVLDDATMANMTTFASQQALSKVSKATAATHRAGHRRTASHMVADQTRDLVELRRRLDDERKRVEVVAADKLRQVREHQIMMDNVLKEQHNEVLAARSTLSLHDAEYQRAQLLAHQLSSQVTIAATHERIAHDHMKVAKLRFDDIQLLLHQERQRDEQMKRRRHHDHATLIDDAKRQLEHEMSRQRDEEAVARARVHEHNAAVHHALLQSNDAQSVLQHHVTLLATARQRREDALVIVNDLKDRRLRYEAAEDDLRRQQHEAKLRAADDDAIDARRKLAQQRASAASDALSDDTAARLLAMQQTAATLIASSKRSLDEAEARHIRQKGASSSPLSSSTSSPVAALIVKSNGIHHSRGASLTSPLSLPVSPITSSHLSVTRQSTLLSSPPHPSHSSNVSIIGGGGVAAVSSSASSSPSSRTISTASSVASNGDGIYVPLLATHQRHHTNGKNGVHAAKGAKESAQKSTIVLARHRPFIRSYAF
jgi:hypothetical protein